MINIEQMHVNSPDIARPVTATPRSAGVDLRAAVFGKFSVLPGRRETVPCGIKIAIPHGYYGMICSRSGLASKYGIIVANAPGIIDSDYRGEIKVILANLDHHRTFTIERGDRIAQLLLMKQTDIAWKPWSTYADEPTERGEGGGGSTGVA